MKEFFAPAKRPSALRDIEEEDDIGDEFIEENMDVLFQSLDKEKVAAFKEAQLRH